MRQSPSMARFALAAPDVELWVAELRPARGVVPHTVLGEVAMTALPLGWTGSTGSGGAGEGGGGEGGGGEAGASLGTPRAVSMASSADMAAATFSRPPVMVLLAAPGTLSTELTMRLFMSPYARVTPRLQQGQSVCAGRVWQMQCAGFWMSQGISTRALSASWTPEHAGRKCGSTPTHPSDPRLYSIRPPSPEAHLVAAACRSAAAPATRGQAMEVPCMIT